MATERTTKADAIAVELLNGALTVEDLVMRTGAARRHVHHVLRRLVDAGEAERVELWQPGRAAPMVVYRETPTETSPARLDCWTWCVSCGGHAELAGAERQHLQEVVRKLRRWSHDVGAARLVMTCASCRRRRGDLPPIGG